MVPGVPAVYLPSFSKRKLQRRCNLKFYRWALISLLDRLGRARTFILTHNIEVHYLTEHMFRLLLLIPLKWFAIKQQRNAEDDMTVFFINYLLGILLK